MSSVRYINSPEELDELFEATQYVAVDFYADWCGPCKAIGPVYDEIAQKHGAADQLVFAKVNVDTVSELAKKHSISAMPTFLFFKNGERILVNGQPQIRGADPRALNAAAEELKSLAAAA